MKCPFCNTEMIQIPDIAMWICKNDDCITPPKEEFYVSDYIAVEWQARAEKAESELKAIKERIEAVNIDDICEITHHLIETLDTAQSITLYEKILNFIKQIGGVK